MHKGERLINTGNYAEAIPVLSQAVQLLRGMPPNVQATSWNLLGLAYHGAGQQDAASRAYLEALKYDRNLWAADYNLGCLCLDQGNYLGAIDYFTTYTSSHQKDYEGYLLLGRARLKVAMESRLTQRDRQIQMDNARLDYEYAFKLHPTAEACNALGVIELQRRIPGSQPVKSSIEHFRAALQLDPHYGPALLDLAIVLQRYANEPRDALDTYRQYLALQPAPPQAADVQRLAHQLDVNLRITIVPHSEQPVQTQAVSSNGTVTARQAQPQTLQTARTTTEAPPPKPASAPPVNNVSELRPAPSRETYRPPADTSSETEAEAPQAPAQVPISAVPPPVAPAPPPAAPVSTPASQPAPAPAPETAKPNANITMLDNPEAPSTDEKKGTFFQKLNPANWFKSKKADTPAEAAQPETLNIERYTYPVQVTPIPGDRKLAEQLTTAGQQAEHQLNRSEAMRDYQDALKADPNLFRSQPGPRSCGP